MRGDDSRMLRRCRPVIASAAKQSICPRAEVWIASRSLSSGAHSRDPLARNDVERARATKQLRRRLRDVVFAGEQMNQRALDRGLPGRRVDLGAEQVGDVEHVARAFAEGRDMGGGNVEVELRDRGGALIQQAGAVEAGDLDPAVAVLLLV